MTRLPLLAGALALLLGAQILAPAALSYDPEAWLVWGGELARGTLDVTAGPAIKPLPMLVDAGLAATFGTDAAWHLWSLASRSFLLVALLLSWQLVYGESGRRAAAALAVTAVLATPTMLTGALEGASESAVLVAMLFATRLAVAGRLPAAAVVLALAALLRPEALVLGTAVLVIAVVRPRRHRGDRPAALVGASVCIAVAPVLWLVLQRLGGGTTAGGVGAATALRAGQPGLAEWPAIAALWSAVLTIPWLVLLAVAVQADRAGGVPLRDEVPLNPRSPDHAGRGGAVPWLTGFAVLWVLTVVGMSEVGFSGETRYLAPGIAAGAVAIVAWWASARAPGRRRAAAPRDAVAIVLASTAVALVVVPALSAQRDRARAQADLRSLLAVVSADDRSRCPTLAVPRFLRPAVALRTSRPMSSIQSPSLDGTVCALQRDLRARPGPDGAMRRLRARSGEWSWWIAER